MAEDEEEAAELSELDVEGSLFRQNDSVTPTWQASRSHRKAGSSLQYCDRDHDGKNSIYSDLDGIPVLFSSAGAQVTQAPLVVTPLSEEHSWVCNYHTATRW